jgi:hypothetical protein
MRPLLSACFFASLFAFSGPVLAEDPSSTAPSGGALLADDDDDLFTSAPPKGNNSGVPDASAFNNDDDEITIAAPIKVEPKPVAPPPPKGPPSRLPLDLNGKTVLADNWAPQVVATDVDSVVVEVPVLYASNGTGFDGTAYWLVAEVLQDGKKVAESRTMVAKEMVSTKGASVEFFKLFAPVAGASGVLEIRVSKLPTAAGAKPSLLFARTVNFALGA